MAYTNAEKQARYRARKRAEGMLPVRLYVSPEQAIRIQNCLAGERSPVTSNVAATPPTKAGKGLRRKRRKLDPVVENNREIFEAHQAEIRRRLATGKKPSAIAAWLNTLGFVGTGATVNWFLK